MAKKRNLEGTCPNQNMFSALLVDDILDLAVDMGVDVDSSDFGTFDLLKDLECARHDLFVKQKNVDQIPQTETVGGNEPIGSPLQIEWLQEEQSDTDDFILVLSKKKAREKRKNLNISPSLNKKNRYMKVLVCK